MTSLKFGTSGLRGLAIELDGPPAYLYTRAFLEMLSRDRAIAPGSPIAVGRDLRASSLSISQRVMAAVSDFGLEPIDCGALPTPALSLFARQQEIPAIMVTGSHIPEDRNGLKFYRWNSEITKSDEAAIQDIRTTLSGLGDDGLTIGTAADTSLTAYISRYTSFLNHNALAGISVGVYQHSSVARDLLVDILEHLGARVEPLGRSQTFVPVDTEALRPQDVECLKDWARSGRFDAIVSTDGDADRPLISDEKGDFVRGDLVGAITSRWLAATNIVVPITANSSIDAANGFSRVVRTRVGSPYVLEAMAKEITGAAGPVVGFEANGGFLLATEATRHGRTLAPLPTRDAVLPILACLASIADAKKPLSEIARDFSFKSALSDRLQNIEPEWSHKFLSALSAAEHLENIGPIAHVDQTDGLRFTTTSGDIVHFRASGNAPELRCYVEAQSENRSIELLANGIELASNAIRQIRIK